MDVDRADNVYVYDCVTGSLQVFDPDHRLIGAAGPSLGLGSGGWFDMGTDGRLYAVGQDDSIIVIEIALPAR